MPRRRAQAPRAAPAPRPPPRAAAPNAGQAQYQPTPQQLNRIVAHSICILNNAVRNQATMLAGTEQIMAQQLIENRRILAQILGRLDAIVAAIQGPAVVVPVVATPPLAPQPPPPIAAPAGPRRSQRVAIRPVRLGVAVSIRSRPRAP